MPQVQHDNRECDRFHLYLNWVWPAGGFTLDMVLYSALCLWYIGLQVGLSSGIGGSILLIVITGLRTLLSETFDEAD